MGELFANGHIIDIVLVLTLVEAAVLCGYAVATGRGVPPLKLLGNMAAGIALMIALRIALVGGWWGWIAACLMASLAAHVIDLGQRWRRAPG